MDYALILKEKYPGSEWTLNGETYDGLEWLSDSKKPTKAQLDAQWNEVQELVANREAEKVARRQAILDRLGITEDEAKLILG